MFAKIVIIRCYHCYLDTVGLPAPIFNKILLQYDVVIFSSICLIGGQFATTDCSGPEIRFRVLVPTQTTLNNPCHHDYTG